MLKSIITEIIHKHSDAKPQPKWLVFLKSLFTGKEAKDAQLANFHFSSSRAAAIDQRKSR